MSSCKRPSCGHARRVTLPLKAHCGTERAVSSLCACAHRRRIAPPQPSGAGWWRCCTGHPKGRHGISAREAADRRRRSRADRMMTSATNECRLKGGTRKHLHQRRSGSRPAFSADSQALNTAHLENRLFQLPKGENQCLSLYLSGANAFCHSKNG